MGLSKNGDWDSKRVDDQTRQQIKRDRLALENLLIKAGATLPDNPQAKFRCPFHTDKNPSAEIRELPSGFYFICYACDLHMDYFALTAFMENVPLRDAFKSAVNDLADDVDYLTSKTSPKQSQQTFGALHQLVDQFMGNHPNYDLQEVNEYEDPDVGSCTFATVRIGIPGGSKKVMQASFTSQTGWQFKQPQGPLPIFNRTKVKNSHGVIVVEGEKCARYIDELGLEGWAATTSAGGSKAAERADWSPLSGKDVVLWRDNDDAGKRYETDVINCIRQLRPPPNSIKFVIVDPLGLNEGEDVVDYGMAAEDQAEAKAAIKEVIETAETWSLTTKFVEHLELIKSGNYRLVMFPNLPMFSRLSQAGLPGKVTMFCGPPGSAKSFIMMECSWMLHELGEDTATMYLEDGSVDYQRRCIAQMSGNSNYTDQPWHEQNPELARQIFNEHRHRVESYFETVTTVEAKLMDNSDILDWVNDQANNKKRVIFLDPITAKKPGDSPWKEDQNLLLDLQRVVNDSGSSLVITNHPRGGKAGAMGLDGMAGGMAWARFTHTCGWLLNDKDGPKQSMVINGNVQRVVSHKRSIILTKARNGSGEWAQLACDLDPHTLRLVEHGRILGKAEQQQIVIQSMNDDDCPF